MVKGAEHLDEIGNPNAVTSWLCIKGKDGDLIYGTGRDTIRELQQKCEAFDERFPDCAPHFVIVVRQEDIIPRAFKSEDTTA